jgi:hypothetical protein
MAKLSKQQKNKIIADYVLHQNYSEVARMHNVSSTTIRKVVKKNPELLNELYDVATDENTKEIKQDLLLDMKKINKIINTGNSEIEKILTRGQDNKNLRVRDIMEVVKNYAEISIKYQNSIKDHIREDEKLELLKQNSIFSNDNEPEDRFTLIDDTPPPNDDYKPPANYDHLLYGDDEDNNEPENNISKDNEEEDGVIYLNEKGQVISGDDDE